MSDSSCVTTIASPKTAPVMTGGAGSMSIRASIRVMPTSCSKASDKNNKSQNSPVKAADTITRVTAPHEASKRSA